MSINVFIFLVTLLIFFIGLFFIYLALPFEKKEVKR